MLHPCTSYDFNEEYQKLNNLKFDPYNREHHANLIGDAITNEEHLNTAWNDISEFLTSCQYKQQKNVKVSSSNQLKVFTLNIRSLVKNIDYLRENIAVYLNYDVLCFNETNLTFSKLPNGMNDIALDGFHEPIVQDPIRSSGRGGGLVMYINKRLVDAEKIEALQPNPEPTNTCGEFQFVKLHQCKGYNRTKIIANVYRSPSRNTTSFNELLDKTLDKLDRHSRKHVSIFGDFNVDLLKYESDQACQDLIEIMTKHGFIQLVSRPTRITDHSATLIDHAYTNNLEDTISCNIITLDISDHLAIVTTINLDNTNSSPYRASVRTTENHIGPEGRIFNESSNAKFRQLIDEEDWALVLDDADSQSQFKKFNGKYTEHYETAYPSKSKHVRRKNERVNSKPWMLPWLEDAIARRDRLHHEYIKEPTESKSETYKKMKNFCEKHVDLAKSKYYKKYFDQHKDNSKKQWQMINSLLNRNNTRKNNIIKLNGRDGNIVSSHSQVAELFNDYFSSIASNLKSQISSRTTFDPGGFQKFLTGRINHSIYLRSADQTEVHEIISKLKNKSTLDTKIEPLKLANECTNFTCTLAKIVSNSFEQGIFPQALKTAKVVPIYKNGAKTEVSNYRPISLLSSFSKVYEKLMHKRILEFLDSNSSLFEYQYGFRPGRSCEHALLNAQNIILNSLSKKEVALLLLIDYSKAFDLVDHNILLHKLEHYGIRGAALNWFKTYLTNREQFVTITGHNSSPKVMQHGVPQGSILGPILFIIYINDLPNISNIAKFILYADDANIIITGQDIREVYDKLDNLSSELVSWVDHNGLVLNLKKTNYMVFSPRKISTYQDVYIAGTKIERKTEARFLGVIIDEKLNWSSHILAVKTKMARYIGLLYKLKKLLPLNARLNIFQSFVQSHLNYCSLVWGFASRSRIDSLFTKQKVGLRAVIPGYVNYRYKNGTIPGHTKDSFKTYGILTVHSVIAKNTLLLMHKIKQSSGQLPQSVKNLMPDNVPQVGDTHDNCSDWLQSYGTLYYRSSIFFKGPLLAISKFNIDATSLPSLFSINIYKSNLKNALLEQQSSGNSEEWPGFLINNIPGLRQSKRTANIANNNGN